jgi:voltage-gated potassium channel
MTLFTIKQKVYKMIEKSEDQDQWSRAFDMFIMVLVFLNMCVIVLESFQELYVKYIGGFNFFEIFTVGVFTVEYLLRIWTAQCRYPTKPPLKAVLRWSITPLALIDMMAIFPFYIGFIILWIPANWRIFRLLRIARLLRFLKLNRYSDAYNVFAVVIRKRKHELLMTAGAAFIVMLISSTFMYYLEHTVQPNAFPNILASFWWAVATLTTVGYGDVVPVTGWGRFLSGVLAFVGIGFVALPTGLISSGFIEIMHKKMQEERGNCPTYCPHCGKKIKE